MEEGGLGSTIAEIMYVYYFVHLDDQPEIWVRDLDRRREMLSRLASESLRNEYPNAERGDLLSVSEVKAVGSGFSIPVSWEAPGLFVGLDGELSLQPVRPGLTQLALRGSYTPPRRGESWDAHRGVEAVVKGFLDSVAVAT